MSDTPNSSVANTATPAPTPAPQAPPPAKARDASAGLSPALQKQSADRLANQANKGGTIKGDCAKYGK
jgi:hypothetical protein